MRKRQGRSIKLQEKSDYEGILTGTKQLGPYPMEKLKRVDQPTTKVTDNIQRIDIRERGFDRALRGDFGPVAKRYMLRGKEPIGATVWEMTTSFIDKVDGEVAPLKAPISEDPAVLSRHIKRLGYFFGADIVGISQLPPWAVCSHDKQGKPIELNHQFAISLVVDQDFKTMNGSTGRDWISEAQAMRSYVLCALMACMMANYIRRLGFPARAHHLTREDVVMPPLFLLAGIGEVSRQGIILNPFLGIRFKASVVTTDLPLLPDKPVDFGLQEFCQQCQKCAIECPSQAISHGDKVMHNGYEVWKLNVDRCTKFRVTNPHGVSCGRCIKVCPWNKPRGWVHDRVRWMVKHTPWLDKSLIKMDDIWGYGKQTKRDKWWFDLEDSNWRNSEEPNVVLQTPGETSPDREQVAK